MTIPALAATATDVWTVAQTVWGEARGETMAGKVAVAQVIRNRHDLHPRWQGRSLAAICRVPWQFSCWNGEGPAKLLALTLADAAYVDSVLATVEVLAGLVTGLVGASTHYYAVGTPEPEWAHGKNPYIRIGGHKFYEHIA